MKTIRILLVEDEAVTAMDLKANLLRLGYEVVAIVATGDEALRQTAILRPDLILMDITLAGEMTGIQAAAAIKEAHDIPIIYLTAHSDSETIDRAKPTEPFGYLPKPCGLNTLISTIEMAIYKGEAERARRLIDAELKQVLAEQKIILDNLGNVVLFLKNRKILWSNPALERVFGYSPAELKNQDTELLYPDRDSYLETGKKGYAALAHGGAYTLQTQMKKKNGALIWCDLTGQAVNPAIPDEGSIWIIEDISDRLSLQAEISKAKNLASLGILAGGIAHDFNNLFQGLLGNITLARMHTDASSEAMKFLQNAEEVYAAAAKLTGQLVAFSSGGMSVRVDLQPAAFIQETVSSEPRESGLTVDLDLAGNLCLINVDPVQFRQVITHMVANAREAMPDGGKLTISAVNETLADDAAKAKSLAPGNYLHISVADTGAGISPENLPKIFDPYFSTKSRGAKKGMGLGLSLCNTIIVKHGGTITVESELGKGSLFHIYLPNVAIISPPPPLPEEKKGHDPRILIMDDDQFVTLVATKFLQSSGFRVSSAADGKAAIAAYQQAMAVGDPFALVILDLTIPNGMGGKETFAHLQQIDPQVKAIVSSGYCHDPAMTDFAAYGFVEAFEKPYRLDAMKEKLARLLRIPTKTA